MIEKDNLRKLPITFSQRIQNRRGRSAVSCEVSDRYLKFSEESSSLKGGEFISLDVMTVSADEQERKLCELVVTRENLLKALSHVKPQLHDKK